MTSSPKITLCRWAGSFEPVTRGVSNSTSRAPSLSSCGKENTQSVRKYHREHDASLQPGPRARPRVFLTNIESYLEKEEGQVPLRADPSKTSRQWCGCSSLSTSFCHGQLLFITSCLSFPIVFLSCFCFCFVFSPIYFRPVIPGSSGSFPNALLFLLLPALPRSVVLCP